MGNLVSAALSLCVRLETPGEVATWLTRGVGSRNRDLWGSSIKKWELWADWCRIL